MEPTLIQEVAYNAIPLILAITLHEAAHGYVAGLLGDTTARSLGRVTANPIPHIDLVGTIILPAVLLLTKAGILFGWAKPVPVVAGNLRRPIRDMGFVAFAGPGVNFAMAFGWAVVYKLLTMVGLEFTESPFLFWMASAGVQWNLILALLNLIPVPPLDGGRILVSLLPRELAKAVSKVEPFGLFILIGLLLFGGLWDWMYPILLAAYKFTFSLVGINVP